MRNLQPGQWLSEKLSQRYVGDYKPFVFVDGEGVRCSLYLSGCLFACAECFSEATWNFRYGEKYTQRLEDQILADLGQEYVQGLTLLGGEPFLNTGVCLALIDRVRRELGTSKDIWSWTGYTFEELLLESADKLAMLGKIDVVVDGRFELAKRDLSLQFRGSSNQQRIIDVKQSLASGQVTLWGELKDATSSYEQIEKRNLI
ncbi:anaerobic ribonucleoside-triphosphate reductase activating protein [Cryobacterium sp. Y11]|uniref:anaerobic ribonucleoside-triphosphate reductase activating protein n=1 Tax=Cryobacterium sp. Y11 TaxID=2045016 RepID=UPI000CE424B3|nr:anaerobic ribonucleoside-triphosphate reductase activating protein [Cryobacterium sp. Y11]